MTIVMMSPCEVNDAERADVARWSGDVTDDSCRTGEVGLPWMRTAGACMCWRRLKLVNPYEHDLVEAHPSCTRRLRGKGA